MIKRLVILLLFAAPVLAEPVAHGWIPSRLLRQGHVQLMEQDEGLQLEILLHTRFMDRVVNTIVEKEQGNWPDDHPYAAAYIRLLKEARVLVRSDDGRESMRIVFSLLPEPGEVSWYGGEVDDEPEIWRMSEPRLLARHEASRDYLLRNAALIIEDSLGIDPATIPQLPVAP
jgi:hypothetical protein